MKLSYYILNENDEVTAIFQNEEYARDYLDYMGLSENYCKKGVVNESIFRFEEHDAKYHTMEDSSLNKNNTCNVVDSGTMTLKMIMDTVF